MLIDTHCHLDAAEFDGDRAEVYRAAREAGVARLVIPAVAVSGFAQTKAVAASYPGCVAAYGIHPLYVMQSAAADLAALRQWLSQESVVAVGEIGLDHYVAEIDPARQAYFFIEQLKLAREFDLPVLLHVRRAIDPVLAALRKYPVRGGIAHAFNGSAPQAEAFIKLGFKLGFGGAMTYDGSTRIRRLAAELPLSAIVLETDAPDIPPAWLNRGRNTPAELRRMAQTLADLRCLPLQAVIAATRENACAALPGLSVQPISHPFDLR